MKKNAKAGALEQGRNPSEAASGDEALFEALAKTKKRKRRKRIRILLFIFILLAAALFLGTRFLQRQVREQFAASAEEVLSAQAERGTISAVSTSLNQQVYPYSTLFQLTDTGTSASDDSLLRSRTKIERCVSICINGYAPLWQRTLFCRWGAFPICGVHFKM